MFGLHCGDMLRAGCAPVGYRGARVGSNCAERHVVNSLYAPAHAGRLQPLLGFRCALRHCSLRVPVPHLALCARRESFSGTSLRMRSRGERAAEAPQAGAPITVWVKRMDVPGARYDFIKNVDPRELVAELIARWVAQEQLDVRPSLVTLRLVKCGARKPEVVDEAKADVLDDPRLTLAAAGLTDGCSMLAFVAGASNYVSLGGDSFSDTSSATCARLLHITGPLPGLSELQAFLEGPTNVPIPMSDPWLERLRVFPEHTHALQGLEAVRINGAVALAEIVTSALRWPWLPGTSEQHTLLAVESLFVTPLFQLDLLAPNEAQLSMKKQRDSADNSGGMTAPSTAAKPLRPDLQIRSSDKVRLLFKGEDKSESLKDAVYDLTRKMAQSWSSLLYGDLPYLLCYAAAGENFQLFAIGRHDTKTAVPISRVYNVTRLDHRVWMLRLAVQLHRLLQLVNRELPTHMLPVDTDDVRTHTLPNGDTFTRKITFEGATLTARKRVAGWDAYANAFATDFDTLRQVYSSTARSRGLVHAVHGPSLHDDTYSVVLAPLGLRGNDAEPTDEEGLRAAAHGVLHGLAALHAAGFVHCDLRWGNVACEPAVQRRYFLLDLEACRRAGVSVAPDKVLTTWSSEALEPPAPGETAATLPCYTTASDIRCFGSMMRACVAARRPLSAPAMAFLARFLVERHSELPSAVEALKDPWLKCAGSACLDAGATPL